MKVVGIEPTQVNLLTDLQSIAFTTQPYFQTIEKNGN